MFRLGSTMLDLSRLAGPTGALWNEIGHSGMKSSTPPRGSTARRRAAARRRDHRRSIGGSGARSRCWTSDGGTLAGAPFAEVQRIEQCRQRGERRLPELGIPRAKSLGIRTTQTGPPLAGSTYNTHPEPHTLLSSGGVCWLTLTEEVGSGALCEVQVAQHLERHCSTHPDEGGRRRASRRRT